MGINKAERSREVTFTLGAVIINCRGLVDPKDKPFGRVLPLEVQIRIMFWVECFYTMDKRKKLLQESKVRCDRPPTTPWTGSMVEPSGVSPAYAQDNPLSSLPPNIRPQVIGE